MARFFIDRPIFAWVIAIVIMLAGVLSIRSLPIEQYPTIAPPTVQINATYPGASAETVEDAVTQVVEQNMNGLDGLLYMSSSSSASGSASITLTFDASIDPDIAQVQVQNKLQLATPLLPQAVQRQGIQVTKSASGFLMVVGLVSTDGSMSNNDLGDYIASSVLDPISRVDGVGNTRLLGSQAAMRIWLDPDKMTSYALAVSDISAAVEAQNAQVSAGELGGLPAVEGQQLNATITAQTRLRTAEEFRNIVIRANPDGSAVRLRDVARVELGSQSYSVIAQFSGKPAAGLGIYLATGANALKTADAVKQRLNELSALFPPGVEVVVPYDSTPFVRLSIEEVVKTLIEAVFLVFLVMYLFLGNLRATFVPAIAVPVVLLGTFAVLSALGFSINTLTMFATVLAIGLLVDDAIVVVENVERIMHEEGLSPLEATRRSMDQITGALIGIATVLSAVFVPMAFFGGSTGAIYRQFSITIVSAMALSVLVALTLSPALCATILKPPKPDHGNGGFFGAFNRWFERGAGRYQGIVGTLLQKSMRMMLIYLALGGVMVFLFLRMPTAFLPDEDQGTLMVMAQLPPGATQQRTQQAMREVQKYFLAQEPVKSIFTVAGFSFSGQGQNAGMGFVHLRDWSLRPGNDQTAQAIAQKANRALSQLVRDASIFVIAPPPIRALGTSSGFDVQMQDLGGVGHEVLVQARNQFLGLAQQRPELVAVRPNGMDDTPQFKIDVDADQAGALGVAMGDVNTTLSTLLGGTYVNDFIDGTRVKRVYMQADAPARMLPDDIKRFHVRNNAGAMVPLSAFSTSYWTYGSPKLERYNGQSSIEILGAPAPGVSSGEAMAAVEQIMQQMPPGISYQWTGLSYQERLSGSQAPALYALSILIVFLCLAALYESWSVPFAVMLVVPLGVIGALAAAGLRGLSNDVYFQVGLLTTIGLSAKNAILIVEFAKSEMEQRGVPLIEATMRAVRLRLRPILMTSLAFMLGVLPLAIASGAGSGSQNAIGTGVLGGMLSATVLGLFFIPVFFVMVRRVFKAKLPGDTASTSTSEVPR
ncbi:efflux RND transporter permease subunit [Sinimarinibacterium sp. CAU 1509]|uniref:efflux RND transporter permease subunit n=1 Tax=Sinimarinibacterium sp. CAU 1509 TaxID=2562283 RepID=UPI0010ABEE1C|nr:efflux RND transporter permease subunit [Sinimarinibacterium sp. CAU 1509]TJY55941.1 efflux RND transporter permease subunit [Sinimarinibacterium sp. CAU 1509]